MRTCSKARRSQKQPTLGVLRWRWQLRNQHGRRGARARRDELFALTPP
jgi:hypothetical protein